MFSIWVSLLYEEWSLETHLAALLYTFSTLLILAWVYRLHTGGILDLGSNKSIIGCLSYAFMFSVYVSMYEAQGPICFDGHILDMVIFEIEVHIIPLSYKTH